MTLEVLRPYMKDIMAPLIYASRRAGLTPDMLTVGALIAAAASGIGFYMGNVLLGTLFVVLNAVMDGLDGALARVQKIEGKRGDFLDHVADRYADIFIIIGIFAGGFASWQVGVFALTGILMSSYLGTQAQAVGVGRYYGGVLGRADRLVLLIMAGLLTLVIPGLIFGLSLLCWLLLIFGVMGHITAIQRFAYVWKRMP